MKLAQEFVDESGRIDDLFVLGSFFPDASKSINIDAVDDGE